MKRKKIATQGRRSSSKRPQTKAKPTLRVKLKSKPASLRKKRPLSRKSPAVKPIRVSHRAKPVAIDTSPRPVTLTVERPFAPQEKKQRRSWLPWRYYDDRIMAVTRDPWWIHAYWDISEEKEKQVLNLIPSSEKPGLKRILRVYDVTDIPNFTGSNAHDFFDLEINDLANSWYINTDRPGRWFCVDIGFLSQKRKFYLLARSNVTKTPCFGISPVLDEEWYLPDDEYFRMLGIYDLGKSSLQRRRKLEEIFKKQISSFGASEAFSPMQRKALKKFFLEVNTELIVYGKTEPDASVTLKQEKIKLNKDGTFSFRFALPEGSFEFPIEATSSSGKMKIKKTPLVKRTKKE